MKSTKLIFLSLRFNRRRSALEAVAPTEQFPEPSISKFFLASEGAAAMRFIVRMDVGSKWLLAGTVSINPVLGMIGLFLCFSWRVCGWTGVDRWLLPALGLPWKPGTWFSQEPHAAVPPS